MKQKRIRLSLTRRDAAVLMVILCQTFEDEAHDMLTPEDQEAANRIVGRLQKLLQPRWRRNQ